MTRALIVGTGDMAHALCHLFMKHNYLPNHHGLAVSKPDLVLSLLKQHPTLHETGVPLVDLEQGLVQADMVLLAIPASALKAFVKRYYSKYLKAKVVVDLTNSSIPGEDLQALLDLTDTPWVKAFQDNGAGDLLLDQAYYKKPCTTTMCGNNEQALTVVQTFAEQALGFQVRRVPSSEYPNLAVRQNSFGRDWVHAAYVILVLFAITEIYALLRYNVFKGYDWFHLPLQVTNKAICWTSLDAFAMCMLPGILARIHDAVHGNSSHDKPHWIRWGLQIRKPLGLLALWCLGIHVTMSLLLFNQKYYGKFFLDPSLPASKMNAIGETSFFFAIFGTALYAILGICSLPTMDLTSRSWQLVYGPLAWIALSFGTIHVLIMGVKGWDEQETWPGGLPPITLTSVLIPFMVMFLKLCQIGTRYAIRNVVHNPSKYTTTYQYDGIRRNSFHDEEEETELMEHGNHSSKTALVQYRGTSSESSHPPNGGSSSMMLMDAAEVPSNGGAKKSHRKKKKKDSNMLDNVPSLHSIPPHHGVSGGKDDGSMGPYM